MKKTKSMVLTITPNPSLDITGTVDHIIPNEKCYVLNEKNIQAVMLLMFLAC